MPLRLHKLVAVAAWLALGATVATSHAATTCRIAFDMGSSGIRAGASDNARTARRDLDALGPLWAGRGIAAIEPGVVAALRELPADARFGDGCSKVGGGFSAWRLALQQDPKALVSALGRIHAATGVAVLVVPPETEGSYAYAAARQTLGPHLTTTHVLDIGGGSLQVAGEQRTLALPLGQKSWHRLLCERLRDTSEIPCALQPMDDRDQTRARALLAVRLAGNTLPENTTMTATSRPVTRGVQPAVQRLAGHAPERSQALRQAEVRDAIARLSPLDLAGTQSRTGASASHAAFLLSDLILVDALIGLAQDRMLHVAEVDLDNLPGLLADERAFAWHGRYACYLRRLAADGIAAYASDPTTCPATDTGR